MTDDFTLAREAFAASVIGRILVAMASAARSAWRTSSSGHAMRSLADRLRATPTPALTANLAVALAIAAGMQPLLASVMPRTVVPAVPWPAFALIAGFAAAVAWQPDATVKAWQASRFARWIRR